MDYKTKIDEQTWAFIHKTAQFHPPETASFPIEEQRRIYDDMCKSFHAGHPDGLGVETTSMNGVPVRIYAPSDSAMLESGVTIVYIHGGGFVVGGLDSHDDICAEISARTKRRVVAIDYRLTPEHKHPAAFDDVITAINSIAARYQTPLLLVGDSAGGNLVAAASGALRGDDIAIIGQVLVYPAFGGDMTKGSYITHANAPMLSLKDVEFYHTIRGTPPKEDPTFAPLGGTDFTALPPSVIFSAECDPLCDDGRDYRDAMLRDGGKAYWICETGLVHGYLRARNSVDRVRDSFDRIIHAISSLSNHVWPYS
ncbi:lipase/esterase [Amylibacter ulvae]|uniref:Lipase/esterase n=1 Tax=Paramylibacter ulvae TaxID=1651968 RepID=A0ABQ3D116_9RHOB|nr:alpha/beta hydrolase [Amylibacter ulvae]GHA45983.1 lipase/esterase [Amylibacter ulvae]